MSYIYLHRTEIYGETDYKGGPKFVVGFFSSTKFHEESWHDTGSQAAERVSYLNGGMHGHDTRILVDTIKQGFQELLAAMKHMR